MINDINRGNIDNFSYTFKYLNENEKINIINILINKTLENFNENFIKSLKKIKNNNIELIENTVEKIINNLDDIILDIPDICNHLKEFIKELELKEELKIILNEKMENLSDSDEDDNEFSFRK